MKKFQKILLFSGIVGVILFLVGMIISVNEGGWDLDRGDDLIKNIGNIISFFGAEIFFATLFCRHLPVSLHILWEKKVHRAVLRLRYWHQGQYPEILLHTGIYHSESFFKLLTTGRLPPGAKNAKFTVRNFNLL